MPQHESSPNAEYGKILHTVTTSLLFRLMYHHYPKSWGLNHVCESEQAIIPGMQLPSQR